MILMTVEELILIDSRKVRASSNLMAIYIEVFTNHFGYAPNCAGCTFNRDFKKLKAAIRQQSAPKTQKIVPMENTGTTFRLKKKTDAILTYIKDKRPHRIYDHRMTEAFAVAFLTHGTKQEIESRKKLFEILPEAVRPKEKKANPAPLQEEGVAEAQAKPKAKRKSNKQPENNE